MDGDGTVDVTGPALRAAITATFDTLAGLLDVSDHLFIYSTDHGSPV